MTKVIDKLIRHGIMYCNPSFSWTNAPHNFAKPGPAEWYFTVELGLVSKYTIPYQFLMQVIEHKPGKTARFKKIPNVDFTHSYWQLRLVEDSCVCQSIITLDGKLTPTCVLHGTTSAFLHLQSLLTTELPPRLMERVLLWVDDCLFLKESTELLLQNLRRIIKI